ERAGAARQANKPAASAEPAPTDVPASRGESTAEDDPGFARLAESVAKRTHGPKEPAPEDWEAYRFFALGGFTQETIAKKVAEKFSKPRTQGQISESLKRCR